MHWIFYKQNSVIRACHMYLYAACSAIWLHNNKTPVSKTYDLSFFFKVFKVLLYKGLLNITPCRISSAHAAPLSLFLEIFANMIAITFYIVHVILN